MVEHRTVAPDVAGSIPVTHPISFLQFTQAYGRRCLGVLLLGIGVGLLAPAAQAQTETAPASGPNDSVSLTAAVILDRALERAARQYESGTELNHEFLVSSTIESLDGDGGMWIPRSFDLTLDLRVFFKSIRRRIKQTWTEVDPGTPQSEQAHSGSAR